jgi:hypothetical protein
VLLNHQPAPLPLDHSRDVPMTRSDADWHHIPPVTPVSSLHVPAETPPPLPNVDMASVKPEPVMHHDPVPVQQSHRLESHRHESQGPAKMHPVGYHHKPATLYHPPAEPSNASIVQTPAENPTPQGGKVTPSQPELSNNVVSPPEVTTAQDDIAPPEQTTVDSVTPPETQAVPASPLQNSFGKVGTPTPEIPPPNPDIYKESGIIVPQEPSLSAP